MARERCQFDEVVAQLRQVDDLVSRNENSSDVLRDIVEDHNSTYLDLYDCRYGRMLVLSHDDVIGRSLRLYGEWAQHELSILQSYVTPGATVVDVGANVGTHTLALSRWAKSGRVIAIEAQPVVSSILRINCRQNNCVNVQVINAICADAHGVFDFRFDYTQERNYGAVSFARRPTDTWRRPFRWFQWRRGSNGVQVPITTLNELCRDEMVAVIKIDIEGMELDALRGADKLLTRCHPVLYFEQSTTTRLVETYDYLTAIGYRMFWLETHPFNRNNFRCLTENIWWRTETGIIALPKWAQIPNDLVEVRRTDPSAPHRLDARAGISLAA